MSRWTTKYKDKLPDSAFMYVAPGGRKVKGRTHPLSKRHLPYRNHLGNVSVNHVRNALARLDQVTALRGNVALQRRIRAKLERVLSRYDTKHRNPLYEVPVATKHMWTVLGWNGRSWYLWGPNGAAFLYDTKAEAKRDIIDGGVDLRYDQLAIVPVDVPSAPPR